MRFLLNNKVLTLLGNTVNFFFPYGKQKLLFQLFEVDWLGLKLAAILARPKQPSDITGCVALAPRWKFRVIMGEETSVWSPQEGNKFPFFYKQYVDDTLTIMPDLSNANAFLNKLNSCHENLNFTMEIVKYVGVNAKCRKTYVRDRKSVV